MRSHPSNSGRDGSEAGPLSSRFADDPEMLELIEFFLSELDQKVQSIERAFSSGESTELRVLAHQLSGAAGGYGFPEISQSAASLEEALKAGEAACSTMSEKVEALIHLCRRAGQSRRAA